MDKGVIEGQLEVTDGWRGKAINEPPRKVGWMGPRMKLRYVGGGVKSESEYRREAARCEDS